MATLASRMLLPFFALAFSCNTSLYVRVPATFVSLRDSRHTLARPGAERKENNRGADCMTEPGTWKVGGLGVVWIGKCKG